MRAQRGLTQAALARASGVSQSAIANYEAGARYPAKAIFKLAEALTVDAQWLAHGPEHAAAPAGLTGPSTYEISDGSPLRTGWPFATIAPQQYWSLPPTDRELVENTVASLIATLKKRAADT